MARKPTTRTPDQLDTEATVIDHDAHQQAQQAMTTVAAIQASYADDRDLVNQLLGQAQMADAMSQFSRTVRLSKLAHVKETKLYRALAGKKMPNGSALQGTWEEFCNLLGHSKDKVDLDLQNLRAFGAEALDSMSRMGIGYRELRQYRQLPEDGQLALIEAAKAGDKDELLDLAETLIARQQAERDSLQRQIAQRDDDIARLNTEQEESLKLTREKDAQINALTKHRRTIERSGARAQADELLVDMDAAAIEAATAIHRLRDNVSAIQAAYEDAGEALDEEVAARIEQNLELAKGWAESLADELGGV